MTEILSFFKYLATTNTINFILMVIILVWLVKKMNLSSLLNKGINQTLSKVNSSEQEKSSAQDKYTLTRKELSQLPQKLKELQQEAECSATALKNNIDNAADIKVDKIKQNINKTIYREEKTLSSQLIKETIEETVKHSKANMINILKNNPDMHNKLIKQSIIEFERAKL